MHKKDIVIGFVAGTLGVCLGIFLFDLGVTLYKGLSVSRIFNRTFSTVLLDKRASIGALFNLVVFYFFLNKNKDHCAKGVILATIVVAILFLIDKL